MSLLSFNSLMSARTSATSLTITGIVSSNRTAAIAIVTSAVSATPITTVPNGDDVNCSE